MRITSTDNRSSTIAGLSVVGGATGDCSIPAASAASMASTNSCRLALSASISRLAAATARSFPLSRRDGVLTVPLHDVVVVEREQQSEDSAPRRTRSGRGARVGTPRRRRRQEACSYRGAAITRDLAGVGAPIARRANRRPLPRRRAGTRPRRRRPPRTRRRATSATLDRRRWRRRRSSSSWSRNRSVHGTRPIFTTSPPTSNRRRCPSAGRTMVTPSSRSPPSRDSNSHPARSSIRASLRTCSTMSSRA